MRPGAVERAGPKGMQAMVSFIVMLSNILFESSDAEPPPCNTYFANALISDEGRSHGCCSGKASYGAGRVTLRRRLNSRR